ncbi:hypothetical protein D1007_37652 [Hordeum vulgare]|nr:hypothetical protein D1007_37652 [Hordeum vulgare]
MVLHQMMSLILLTPMRMLEIKSKLKIKTKFKIKRGGSSAAQERRTNPKRGNTKGYRSSEDDISSQPPKVVPVVQFNKDFDVEIIAVFFATIHLGTDEARTLQWMSNGRLLSAPWKSFMDLLHIEDKGLETPLGFRPNHEYATTHKQALYKFNTEKISSTTGKST